MGPRALPASVVLRGIISAQQTAASCRRQRARAVTATTESRQKHARTSVLAALPLPNHAESAAADLATSYTGLGIPVLPIEAARTYAPGISTGAVAVFRAFSRPAARRPPSERLCVCAWSPRGTRMIHATSSHPGTYIYTVVFGARGWLPAGAWLNGMSRPAGGRCSVFESRRPESSNL